VQAIYQRVGAWPPPGRLPNPLSAKCALSLPAIVLASMLLMLTSRALAEDEQQILPPLAIGVGDPGSPSYMLGLWVTSLLGTEVLVDDTKMRVEIWESLSPTDRITILFEEAQVAVVTAAEAELETPRAQQYVRAAVGLANGNQVLVRADLSDDFVYDLTSLMFEYSDLMRSLYPEFGDLEPNGSLERIEGSVHPGAMRFYEKYTDQDAVVLPAAGTDLLIGDPPVADPDKAATSRPASKSFTVYFDFDDAEFDMNQIGVVQAACGYASNLPAPEFVLSGHADTLGPEAYNEGLSLARAQSVASLIRNDPRFRDALHLIKFGERDLAVPTKDEVAEPKNRRVVITVVPGSIDEPMQNKIEASASASPTAESLSSMSRR
jgi:outer membrane protein OmpA-like peptidoglycan-associated protein